MALSNCPECGAQISDRADSCPHCGYPLRKKAEHRTNRSLARLVFLFLMWACGLISIYILAKILLVIADNPSAPPSPEVLDVMDPMLVFGLLAIVFGLLARKKKR